MRPPRAQVLDQDLKNVKNEDQNLKNDKNGGARRRKPAAPPPDIPAWISWNRETRDLEIADEWKVWLRKELRLHSEWLDAHDPPARQYVPKPFELQETLRNLRAHLEGNPFKTNARSLPTIALNWFKNDLANARRVNGHRSKSPTEKTKAAAQEAIRLIDEHKRRNDGQSREGKDDHLLAGKISEGISDGHTDY